MDSRESYTRRIAGLVAENEALRQGNELLRERLAEVRGRIRELADRIAAMEGHN